MIEIASLETKKIRNNEKFENMLNDYIKKGWRVKCSVGSRLIFVRKVKVQEW